jgi:hypothetical protein
MRMAVTYTTDRAGQASVFAGRPAGRGGAGCGGPPLARRTASCDAPRAMSDHDVIVIGAGISGLTFAHEAARAGRSVLVLERAPRVGGCLSTHRGPSGFWYELAAHTCYNSYYGLTEILDAVGLRGEVVQRAKTHMRMLRGDALVPGSNLGMLMRLFS